MIYNYDISFHGFRPLGSAGRNGGFTLREVGEWVDLLRETFQGRAGAGEFLPVTERGFDLGRGSREWVGAFSGTHGL